MRRRLGGYGSFHFLYTINIHGNHAADNDSATNIDHTALHTSDAAPTLIVNLHLLTYLQLLSMFLQVLKVVRDTISRLQLYVSLLQPIIETVIFVFVLVEEGFHRQQTFELSLALLVHLIFNCNAMRVPKNSNGTGTTFPARKHGRMTYFFKGCFEVSSGDAQLLILLLLQLRPLSVWSRF